MIDSELLSKHTQVFKTFVQSINFKTQLEVNYNYLDF